MENRSSLFGIIAIIIGASGLGLGAFSMVNFQLIEGPEGPQGEPGDNGQDGIKGDDGLDGINGTDGEDGLDGEDAPGGLVVGILDPGQHDTVWGEIEIRALVYGSNNFSVSVKANQTEIGTQLPTFWDTSLEIEGWYNITVIIMDTETKLTASDTVWILIDNPMSSSKDITLFYFKKSSNPNLTESVIAEIDEISGYILGDVPDGTNISALVACFTTTGVSVEVNNVEQISDLTVNDFRGTVNYVVFAEDGSSKEYVVGFAYTYCLMSPNTPLGIPDGDLNGVVDTISFPDLGPCIELSVSIDISGVSSIEFLKVELYDPNIALYVLYDGGFTGHDIAASFPPSATVSGDLTSWLGQNPAGDWELKVIDTDPSGGGTDGTLNDWGITVEVFM